MEDVDAGADREGEDAAVADAAAAVDGAAAVMDSAAARLQLELSRQVR